MLVGTLVVIARCAMFVACDNMLPVNGCKCTLKQGGRTESTVITLDELVDMGYTSCSQLSKQQQESANAEAAMGNKSYADFKITCSSY